MRTEAMNPQLIEAIIGCLLHDIGKPVQRAALGYPGRHSAIGRAFMKKVWLRDSRNPSQFTDEVDEADIGVSDRRILDAISYQWRSVKGPVRDEVLGQPRASSSLAPPQLGR